MVMSASSTGSTNPPHHQLKQPLQPKDLFNLKDLCASAPLREIKTAPLERVFSNAGTATGSETDTNVRATFTLFLYC